MKPVVDIKDCYLYMALDDREYLSGIPVNYPDNHQAFQGALENGSRVYTSEVVNKSNKTVVTKRTQYNILNWIDHKSL